MPEDEWIASLKLYVGADKRKSIRQFSLTLFLYAILVASMIFVVVTGRPYWMALCLALPAAGFHVKLFIIMHDCGHNSFFNSPKVCTWIGRICAVITFTPYFDWRRTHARHHATVSNLENRGVGDVWTMTLEEFRSSSKWKRFRYRLFRNPVFLFLIAPTLQFLLGFRFPLRDTNRKSLWSVLYTDLFLGVIIGIYAFTIGITAYLKVILPVTFLAGIAGFWLFYIQHQFRKVYWAHNRDWDSLRAAMEGSSFYKLPGVLRWFSGSIGFHHIHHLNSRIPNYKLRKCNAEIPEVREITPITIHASLRSLFLHLWDEESGELVRFGSLR